MPCCKCNRSGSCKGCACVNAGYPCANCLPSKFGHCNNCSSHCSFSQSTDPIPFDAPPLPLLLLQGLHRSPVNPPPNAAQEPSIQLPTYKPMSELMSTWGNHSATNFSTTLEATYVEVVHWRRNSFTVSFARAGRELLCELLRLDQAFDLPQLLKELYSKL